MAQLAIKGHKTRAKEVIQLLEMLGGENKYNLWDNAGYYVIECGEILGGEYIFGDEQYTYFTLEEFEKKFPYKIGDKVIYEDKIREITKIVWEEQTNTIAYKLDDKLYCNVIDDLQPYKESNMKDNKATGSRIDFSLTERIELDLGDTHEVVVENGKTYVVKKKPTYPKYYTECEASGLSLNPVNVALAQGVCMGAFAKLIVIRNAYWEIAGKQLGLDKPWKPKHEYDEEIFFIYCDRVNGINKGQGFPTDNFCLSFPTAEIRDTFYENFNEEIEMCKELL